MSIILHLSMSAEKLFKLAELFGKYAMTDDEAAALAEERDLRDAEEGTGWYGSQDFKDARKDLVKGLEEASHKSKMRNDQTYREHHYEKQTDERRERRAIQKANRAVEMENIDEHFDTLDDAINYFKQFYNDDENLTTIKLLYAETDYGLADAIRRSEGKKTRIQEMLEKLPPANFESTEEDLEEWDL